MRQRRIPPGAQLQGGFAWVDHWVTRSLQEGTTNMNKLIDEKQAAALLHVSVKSLQGWRYRGGGPEFVKLGRSVRYEMSDLEDFVQAARRTSTSDLGRQKPIPLSQLKAHLKTWHDQPRRALERAQAAASRPPTKPQ